MRGVSIRALARPILLRAALSTAFALLGGCGETSGAGPAEAWPLTLPEPGVLGYAAVSLPQAELTALLTDLLGWAPEGLAADRPFVTVRLESATFGGPVAVIAPIADGPAFLSSLQANPLVEVTSPGHYRVRIPPQTTLGMLLLLSSAPDMTSPAGLLSALQQGLDTSFALEIQQQGDVIFAVPSFEALSLCRNLHGRLDGPPPADIVLSVDLARVQTVYAQDIRAFNDQLRGLISGARVGAPLLMGLQAGGGLHLPVNWELLWAAYDMLEGRQFAAAQLWLSLPAATAAAAAASGQPASGAAVLDDDAGGEVSDAESAREDESELDGQQLADHVFGPLERLRQVSLRVRLAEGSRLRAVADSLRPAPPVEGAWFEAAAQPDAFAKSFAQWTRPIASVVKGEGPPCDRYVDELAALLAGWGGRLALVPAPNGLPVLMLSTRATDVTVQRWLDWLAPLLATAHIEGLPPGARPEPLEDGTLVVRDADGQVVLRSRQQDGVLWIVPGDAPDPPRELLRRFVERSPPETGATLRANLEHSALQLSSLDGELWASFTVSARGR